MVPGEIDENAISSAQASPSLLPNLLKTITTHTTQPKHRISQCVRVEQHATYQHARGMRYFNTFTRRVSLKLRVPTHGSGQHVPEGHHLRIMGNVFTFLHCYLYRRSGAIHRCILEHIVVGTRAETGRYSLQGPALLLYDIKYQRF